MSIKQDLFGVFVLVFMVGIGFSATTFAPTYTPVPNQGGSLADILGNYSFDTKFNEINVRLNTLSDKQTSFQAQITAQTSAFNDLAKREEDRFQQAEAIKRSDERIQSQLAGMRLFFLISVTFLSLLALFLLRKTLDDFKAEMKKKVKEEVEVDLHNQVRLAVIPTPAEKAKNKKEGEEEIHDKFGRKMLQSPKGLPSLKIGKSPEIEQPTPTPEPAPITPSAVVQPKKEGFFSKLKARFAKKQAPVSFVSQPVPLVSPELLQIKNQLKGDTRQLPMQDLPDVQEPSLELQVKSLSKSVEESSRQIHALLDYTVSRNARQYEVRTKKKSHHKKPLPAPKKAPVKKVIETVNLPQDEPEVDLESG